MSKVVVTEFITVDGVVEAPGGEPTIDRGGWAFWFERGADGDQFKMDELWASGALLLGRTTYEGFAAAWPGREDEAGFADKFNTMPKYVVSSTLQEPLEWTNSHLLKGDLTEEVNRLKQEVDGDIAVHGSAQLVRELADRDLVDEYRLMVFPAILGQGMKLFGDTGAAIKLQLVDAKPVGSDGVVILTYTPKREG